MQAKRPCLKRIGLPYELIVTLLFLIVTWTVNTLTRMFIAYRSDTWATFSVWHFEADEWVVAGASIFLCFMLHLECRRVRKSQQDLLDSEEHFRVLFEQADDGILLLDERINIVDCNAGACRIFGVSGKEELMGKTPLDFSPERQPDGQCSVEQAKRVMANLFAGEMQRFSWQHQQKSGTLVNVEVSLNKLVYKQQSLMQAIVRDVSNRQKIERFSRILEHSLNEIYIFDAKTLRFTDINRGGVKNIGYSLEELKEMTPLDLKPEMSLESFEDVIEPLRTGAQELVKFETVHRRRDGTDYMVEAHLQLFDQGAPVFVAIIMDITERRNAEQTYHKLSTAIDQASESVVITDIEGTIEYVNPAFEKFSGYTPEEAIGKNPNILKSGLHDDAFYQKIWRQTSAGQPWKGRMQNKRKDGTIFTEESTISPIYNDSGELINYVAVKRDISKELGLEEQIRQAQKMEAVGRLAGGIAHDFNNILQTILGFCGMLLMHPQVQQSIQEDVLEIQNAAKRAAALTRQLLTFSRKEKTAFALTDLNAVIANEEKMLARLLDEHLSLIFEPEPDLPPVWADTCQIEQVLMNLVVNARDAMPQGGAIIVRTENATKEVVAKRPESSAHGYVCLSVTDSGEGMSKEVIQHMFEPFFTTKNTNNKGTGLGLAVLYGIVEQHLGWVDVESTLDQGSVFKVYLPVCLPVESPVDKSREDEPRALSDSDQGKRILLVEDDHDVRALAAHILQDAGYDVVDVDCAALALEMFEQKDIDLLISDVVLPDQNGIQLAEVMVERKRELRVMLISGYADQCLDLDVVRSNNFLFLEKPFNITQLLSSVRSSFS